MREDGRTDGRTDMKLIVAFRNFALIMETSFPNQAECSLSFHGPKSVYRPAYIV